MARCGGAWLAKAWHGMAWLFEMRKVSTKTQSLQKKWGPVRKEFLEQFPICCICGGPSQCVDEILRGKNRLRALVERACWLPACGLCNTGDLADPGYWPVERKLAVKLLVDPGWFDLNTVNRVLAPAGARDIPRAYTGDDVLDWLSHHLMYGGVYGCWEQGSC
jgi:hypothetical protein